MTRTSRSMAAVAALLLGAAGGACAAPAPAATGTARWHDVKCARYKKAWSAALARFGTQGLGPAFLDRHAAFLASNCTTKADVCPRSDAEFKLANVMVVLSMNAGTASTFPPFGCKP